MKKRLLISASIVIVPIAVAFQLTTVDVGGQTQDTTAWGHPNLEGIWLDVYDTPFQRAPELADREF